MIDATLNGAQPNRRLIILGRQTFDGLGRQLSVEVGGRTTHFEHKAGQIPPCANLTPDGKRIAFAYVPALDNTIAAIEPEGEPANAFSYHPVLGTPADKRGPLGELALKYSVSGKPLEDRWTHEGKVHSTHWRHSLNGILLELADGTGGTRCYRHDEFGRIHQHVQGEVITTFTYDAFSRLETLTTIDGKRQLAQTLTYDAQGREHTRTFVVTLDAETRTCKQTLLYSDLDQVLSRHWEDGDCSGEETFEYDALGRLQRYCAGRDVAPQDPFGNTLLEQRFAFTLVDGYTTVVSTFADGSTDTATFYYENPLDLTQVSRITHDHASWPDDIVLNYDACGRVTTDSLGRHLTWDAQDRLTRVEYAGQCCDYRYDPAGNLCDRVLDGTLSRSFFSADLLTHEQTGEQIVQRIGNGSALFALNRITNGLRQVTLLGCDAQGSVRLEADSAVRVRRYSAHGAEREASANGAYGYTGERREPLTDWYIPGGNRPYDPLIMGFLSPDSESPFGRGGLNAYAYCGADPINRIDPDGHAWWKWVIAGVGLALGALALVSSFGAAAPALGAVFAGGIGALTASGAASITSATLAAISLGTGIASTVLEATGYDEKAAGILGWVSLGTGLAGSAVEIGPKIMSTTSKLAGRAMKFMKPRARFNGTPTNKWIGSSNVLVSKGKQVEVAVHEKLWGKHLGFETHGDAAGMLMNDKARYVSAEDFTRQIVLPRVEKLNAPASEPLVLLACQAGKTGAAQTVADISRRPVLAFDDVINVASTETLQKSLKLDPAKYLRTNWPTRTRLPGDSRYFAGSAGRGDVPAHYNIFWPR